MAICLSFIFVFSCFGIRGSHYACTLGDDSEDKENSWTSNLIKNGNNDNNAALWGIFCNK